jgi:cytochrome b561
VSRAVASRWQPGLVALHWLIAALIAFLLYLGYFVLANMPNTHPMKLKILYGHMTLGILVFVLMIARTIVRLRSVKPATAVSGVRLIDRLTPISHFAFYLIVFLMVASGWTIGFLIRGAFAPGGHLPQSFAVLAPFQVHAVLAALLATLIAAHVVATLYHQFVVKHPLFPRMWFGRRTIFQAKRQRAELSRNERPRLLSQS